jgi:hypothetical protein
MAALQHLVKSLTQMADTSLTRNHSIASLPLELLLHIFNMCDPDIKVRLMLTHAGESLQ